MILCIVYVDVVSSHPHSHYYYVCFALYVSFYTNIAHILKCVYIYNKEFNKILLFYTFLLHVFLSNSNLI